MKKVLISLVATAVVLNLVSCRMGGGTRTPPSTTPSWDLREKKLYKVQLDAKKPFKRYLIEITLPRHIKDAEEMGFEYSVNYSVKHPKELYGKLNYVMNLDLFKVGIKKPIMSRSKFKIKYAGNSPLSTRGGTVRLSKFLSKCDKKKPTCSLKHEIVAERLPESIDPNILDEIKVEARVIGPRYCITCLKFKKKKPGNMRVDITIRESDNKV